MPQFETLLPLKSLSCQFYVAKKPFRIKEYLQQNFKHGFDRPPPLNNVKKTALFANDGFPYFGVGWEKSWLSNI